MKRIALVACEVLTAGVLAGIYAVQYFAQRKLGMVRWLNYHNNKIRGAIPFEALTIVLAVVILLLVVFLLWRAHKQGSMSGAAWVVALVACVVAAAFALCACLLTQKATPAAFLIIALLGLAALLQLACVLLVRSAHAWQKKQAICRKSVFHWI